MSDLFLSRLDESIHGLVSRAYHLAWRHPAYIPAMYRALRYQKKAHAVRDAHRAEGIPVPAFMIVSVTRRCNLHCKGCYSHVASALEVSSGRRSELDVENLGRVIDEGAALGVSFILLAGGEPLVRAEEIFGMARRNPSVLFPLFTNGTLIDDHAISAFRVSRNLIPVLSIEGGKEDTDVRRGDGVYAGLITRMRALKRAGVFFGVSFTVMKGNVAGLSSAEYIASLVRAGAGLFFYNEYTPVEGGTADLCVDADGRKHLLSAIQTLRERFPALFISFPADEERFGGCLSAGRGFVHVAPDGRLEACPFAPFGDRTAGRQSLREALRSPLLAAIRDHHEELSETSGGCALWNRREWVESLLVQGERER